MRDEIFKKWTDEKKVRYFDAEKYSKHIVGNVITEEKTLLNVYARYLEHNKDKKLLGYSAFREEILKYQ